MVVLYGKILHFIDEQDIHMSSGIMREIAMDMIWICKSSCKSFILYALQEVVAKLIVYA